jgi:predicted DNA-binding transcriptional regulator AlpA
LNLQDTQILFNAVSSSMANKNTHLRLKARALRENKEMPLDDIVERLGVARTTVYEWIKDIPIPRTVKQQGAQKNAQKNAALAQKQKWEKIRQDSYQEGWSEAPTLLQDQLFRDFIVLYMGEGYKKSRNQVAICNSNPRIMKIAQRWISTMSPQSTIGYWLHYHGDQDAEGLVAFWKEELKLGAPQVVKCVKKGNSGELKGRNWNCQYGVFTIRTGNTRLRSKIQAWMNYIQAEWEEV